MYLRIAFIVIVALFIMSSDAFPYSSSLDFDDTPPSIPIDSLIVRRDVFDPYGFNSILSRFVKRDKFSEYPIERTIDFINQDEDDFY